MIPRSIDAQNRAQDLSASILSAASPSQIAAACSAVDSFIRKHASDQCRSFFSVAFPSLICRLFGFDSSSSSASNSNSSSWIEVAAGDPDIAAKLFSLLSPSGILISSIAAVDRLSIVKYVFPSERLPEWIRFVLRSEKYSSYLPELCPLFKSRVKDNQIQLNVFEYYMFWFAYYPVCKGNNENAESGVVRKSRRFRLEQWTSSLPSIVGSNRRSGQKTGCNLYLRLLYAYLRAFVPEHGLGAYQPYRSSLLHYSSSYDISAYVQAEFLVYTFVHFWMVDNDFSPLHVSVCRSIGVSFPFRAVFGETPPTPGLGEVLKLLVKYLNSSLISPTEQNVQILNAESLMKMANSPVGFDRPKSVMVVCENPVGSWNLVMQRPLYRFILRTFLFCPMGTSMKNAAQVFSLWVTYLTPWNTKPDDFAEFEVHVIQNSDNLKKENVPSERNTNGDRKEGSRDELVYAPVWESYVGSNYLFYSSLVVHFLGFAHKFLHSNVEMMVEMVLKILNNLTSSKELMDFLRKVDTAYHSRHSGPFSSYVDNVHKYVSSICEQLQDWEDGLCESDADGSFLHENWNHDLRLFSDGEDGAPKLLQLFVLRAEHEIRAHSGDFRNLDSIRSKMNALFGGPIRASPVHTSVEEPLDHDRAEVFTPKHPGVGRRTWADVSYKGDWMRRPISDSEVACLARLLIRLSVWLNEVIGLDRVDNTDSDGPNYVEIPPDDTGYVRGPNEAFVIVVSLVGSWLSSFARSVMMFMRGHGMRINLRVLASKKFATVLAVYAVACVLKKALWNAAAVSS